MNKQISNIIIRHYSDESELKAFVKDVVKAEKCTGRAFNNYAEYALYTFVDGTIDDIWRFKEQFWKTNTLFSNEIDYVLGLDISKFFAAANDECVADLMKWIKLNSAKAIVIFFLNNGKNTQALERTIRKIFGLSENTIGIAGGIKR